MQLHFILFISYAGHLERHFDITSGDWKEIQMHMESKCRSAYHCKTRALSQTARTFHRQAAQQTASCIHGPRTSLVDTCCDDTELQPEHNSLIAEVEFYPPSIIPRGPRELCRIDVWVRWYRRLLNQALVSLCLVLLE